MLCGDEYERIPITNPAEANLLGCAPGDCVVVRMLEAPLPDSLITPGSGLLIALEPGGLALGRLDEHEGQRQVTCVSGTYPYASAKVKGFVVAQFGSSTS